MISVANRIELRISEAAWMGLPDRRPAAVPMRRRTRCATLSTS